MSQNTSTLSTPNTGDTHIRWGIIGAGHIARTFATDIAYAPHATLTAVASRQLSRAQAFADDFSIPTAYGSYEEILADPNIDAIYIATPHTHHKQQSIDCLACRQTCALRKAGHGYTRRTGRGDCRG